MALEAGPGPGMCNKALCPNTVPYAQPDLKMGPGLSKLTQDGTCQAPLYFWAQQPGPPALAQLAYWLLPCPTESEFGKFPREGGL